MSDLGLRKTPLAIFSAIDDYAERRHVGAAVVARQILTTATRLDPVLPVDGWTCPSCKGGPDGRPCPRGGLHTHLGHALAAAGIPRLSGALKDRRAGTKADWRFDIPAGDHAALVLVADRSGRTLRHIALSILAAWMDAVPDGSATAALLASADQADRERAMIAIAERVELLRREGAPPT